jgi:hypothetical protein
VLAAKRRRALNDVTLQSRYMFTFCYIMEEPLCAYSALSKISIHGLDTGWNDNDFQYTELKLVPLRDTEAWVGRFTNCSWWRDAHLFYGSQRRVSCCRLLDDGDILPFIMIRSSELMDAEFQETNRPFADM